MSGSAGLRRCRFLVRFPDEKPNKWHPLSSGVVGLECVVPRVKRPLSNPCIHLLRSVSSTSSGWDCPESPPLSAEEGTTSIPSFIFPAPSITDGRCVHASHRENVFWSDLDVQLCNVIRLSTKAV